MVEANTQVGLGNLDNTKEIVEQFYKEYKDEEARRIKMPWQFDRREKKFKRGQLLEKYMVNILFGWNNRKFELKNLKRN